MTDSPPVVLVVDDEVQIRRFLRAGLELDGFVVEDAETGADALKSVTLKQPDLVILDLGLPDMDGGDVLERLRSWSTVPLIVLSVRSNESEKVRLLESGADDYVVKPFGMAELLARAHAAMRRQVRATTGEPVVKAGPLTIDLAARIVTLNGTRVTLIPCNKLDYAESQDDYVALVSEGKKHLKQQTIASLEASLDPALFVRIHRSYLVNLERVVRIEPYGKESRMAILATGTRLPVSKTGYARLKALLDERG